LNIKGLQKRLKGLGVDIPDRTLRHYVSKGIVTGPKHESKKTQKRTGRPISAYKQGANDDAFAKGRPGRFYNWPEVAVEQAAAAWAVQNLDTYREPHTLDTVLRTKHQAQELHEMFTTNMDLDQFNRVYQRDFNPKGEPGPYLISYEKHPLLTLWITALEKARHKKLITKPCNVIFDVAIEGSMADGTFRSAFRGVRFEDSDQDALTWNMYRLDTITGCGLDQRYYSDSSK